MSTFCGGAKLWFGRNSFTSLNPPLPALAGIAGAGNRRLGSAGAARRAGGLPGPLGAGPGAAKGGLLLLGWAGGARPLDALLLFGKSVGGRFGTPLRLGGPVGENVGALLLLSGPV